jgi:hypothetical protein
MKAQNNRVVTYLSEKYKNKLQDLCKDREEKEAMIVREIIKEFIDQKSNPGSPKKQSGMNASTA